MAFGVLATAMLTLKSGKEDVLPKEVPASQLMKSVAEGSASSVLFAGKMATATLKDGTKLKALLPDSDAEISKITGSGVEYKVELPEPAPKSRAQQLGFWAMLLAGISLPILLLMWIGRRSAEGPGMGDMGGMSGPQGMRGFISSRTRRITPSSQSVKFSDVAGCDEAKAELEEVVNFLKDATKYQKLGGKIPRGVLLDGPPGTGKTLLAKAVAGEANVPFFSISGSEFVEMFVGVGAARVRDVFAQAKKQGTSIVFIDEIDAIGRQRSSGNGGGSDEREQTLNQLLVEMNGIDDQSTVIVLAATNRIDILDDALTRPGRFDRTVHVDLPDVKGREAILRVHLASIALGTEVDPEVIAKSTPGFSGAELMNLANEAALMAARDDSLRVEPRHFEKALDKIRMGLERKTGVMDKRELLNTAYHEAGHAILAHLLPGCDPVHKVSIVPRGRALGVTVQLPERDTYSLSKTRILSDIKVLFGGRIAEDKFTQDITTGASNDYERANALVRNYVAKWGMSETVGPVIIPDQYGGHGYARSSMPVSQSLLEKIDAEVARVLTEAYMDAEALLLKNSDIMHSMAAALMKHETIDSKMVKDLMDRKLVLEKYELPAAA